MTERCVFDLRETGLTLIEVDPGIDVQHDVLQRLPFQVQVDGPKPMDPGIFRNAPMRLRERMLDTHMEDRLRVRDLADLKAIGDAVDALLGPLGQRVHSVVNYERFSCDDDVFDESIELVKRVTQTYYLSVKRYTSGAFLRHQLGTEMAKRRITSEMLGPGNDSPVPV